MKKSIIISLFDHSGVWSKPYQDAGFKVIRVDIKDGVDILKWNYKKIPKNKVFGMLIAPPCTHFTVSGASFWTAKDKDGRTNAHVKLVKKALQIVKYFKPVFWVLENPVGRLETLVPELKKYRRMSFDPWEFGNGYTKKTVLWGVFNHLLKRKYVIYVKNSGGHHSLDLYLGNKVKNMPYSERKVFRSITPKGFAKAFFTANNSAKVINTVVNLKSAEQLDILHKNRKNKFIKKIN